MTFWLYTSLEEIQKRIVELFSCPGIFFSDGDLWHDQRRFMLRYMRDFGFGRRFDELELEINDELVQLVDFLKNGPKYDFEKVF